MEQQALAAWQQYLAGDDGAFVRFAELCYAPLLRYLGSVLKQADLAQEAAQECFVKLAVKKPRFRGGSMRAWLFTVARNCAYDLLRQKKRRGEMPIEQLPLFDARTEPFAALMQKQTQHLLFTALATLRAEYAEVLYLCYFEGLKNEDTARVMKKSRRQVENLLYRAKTKLREQLQREGYRYEDFL